MDTIQTIRLKKAKQFSLDRKHPWVFSGALHLDNIKCNDGELVYVENEHKQRLGYGHYHKGSITVRIIHFGNEDYKPEIWSNLLQNAWEKRWVWSIQILRIVSVGSMVKETIVQDW